MFVITSTSDSNLKVVLRGSVSVVTVALQVRKWVKKKSTYMWVAMLAWRPCIILPWCYIDSGSFIVNHYYSSLRIKVHMWSEAQADFCNYVFVCKCMKKQEANTHENSNYIILVLNERRKFWRLNFLYNNNEYQHTGIKIWVWNSEKEHLNFSPLH